MARSKRYYYDVRQYAALLDDEDQILVLQLPEHYRPYGGKWTLPGGKLEPDDVPEEGILREIEEETMLQATIEDVIHIGRWNTQNSRKLAIFYKCRVKGRRKNPVLSEEHRSAEWVTLEEVADTKFYSPYFLEGIASLLKK